MEVKKIKRMNLIKLVKDNKFYWIKIFNKFNINYNKKNKRKYIKIHKDNLKQLVVFIIQIKFFVFSNKTIVLIENYFFKE